MKTKIDFAIIGAQKSASTFLHLMVRCHSKVVMPKGETACFESPDFEQGRVALQIEPLLAQCGAHQKAGIKRPSYLTRFEVPARLAAHNPEMRLVAVLRDPIDRFVSAYFHNMLRSSIPVMEINEAIDSMFKGDYLSRVAIGPQLLHYGLYSEGVQNTLAHFARDQLLLLDQADVSRHPQAAFARVCEHVGLPTQEVPPVILAQRPKATLYSYRYARACKPANALLYRYTPGRARIEPRQSGRLVSVAKQIERAARLLAESDLIDPRRALSESSRRLLADYYRRSVAELSVHLPAAKDWLAA